ncbi:hypothetical protein JVU11DRAFT_10670 [Chiua virens]|nr:hypothetical protein JVU11DRAFT_10670 [Chiua virens]
MLNFDGIKQIVNSGILTKKGGTFSILDVLLNVMFCLGKDQYPIHVKELNGIIMQGYCDTHEGPAGYYGTMIPGIPNFYVLAGVSCIKYNQNVCLFTIQYGP